MVRKVTKNEDDKIERREAMRGLFEKLRKYILCVILTITGCGCMMGCANKEQVLTELEEDPDVVTRQVENQELSGIKPGYEMLDCQIAKDKAWVLMAHDGLGGCTYIVDLNDWTARQVEYEDEMDSSLGGEFEEDGIYTTFSADSFPLRFYVKQYDSDGKLLLNQEVTSFITQVRTEGQDVADGCIVGMYTSQDKQVVVMEYQIIVLRDNAQKAEYIPLTDGRIIAGAKMKDGRLICVIEKDAGEKYFQAWNPDNMKWEDSVKITNYWSFTKYPDYSDKIKGMLLNGQEYDFYYKNFYCIYGVNWKDKTYIKLMDNEKSGVDNRNDEAVSMLPIWNGMMITTRNDDDIFEIYHSTKREDDTK